MYIPQDFNVNDQRELLAFIQENAFGELISKVEGHFFASHIPFMIGNGGESLFCHIARDNPQWKELEKQHVLVTFLGAHDYVSPSWYESPGVPTWNYQAVHVYGEAKIIRNSKQIKTIIDDLANHFEATINNSWNTQFNESLLDFIIGIEIQITEIQGKFKLSQNRPKNDRQKIIKAFQKQGADQLSKAMLKQELKNDKRSLK